MSFEEVGAIIVKGVGKSYEIYDKPSDRLKQLFWGKGDRQYFREFSALKDVSFEIPRGTSLGVIGKNGAGKSTLLQIITGTLEPTSGTVKISGKVAAILELGAGFNLEFSGRENIELYCNLLQIPPAIIRERFDQIVDFSEIADFIDQPLKTYSSGMVARLAFSVIAHVDADILIIDEALAVGDAAFSQKCMRFLHQFKKNGSIFFVSHDTSAVKTFCDSALWLDKGEVRAFGDSGKVCDAYLADIYPNTKVSSESEVEEKRISKPHPMVLAKNEELQEKFSEEFVYQGYQQIEAFRFDPDASDFGTKNAEIVSVTLTDVKGNKLAICEGQQAVKVTVGSVSHVSIESPIVGFFVKDRLGQPLFGGNTYLTYESKPMPVAVGQSFEAVFTFRLPTLQVGNYSITAAISSGTLKAHTQFHWMHDAALFKVSASTLDGVLVGIPIQNIEMKVYDEVFD